MNQFIVQKFGGTSVGIPDRLSTIIKIVSDTSKNFKPIVVVSAVSGKEKSSGTTSMLLKAIEEACSSNDYSSSINSIRSQHQALISSILPEKESNELLSLIDMEIANVSSFLQAIAVIREASSRSVDVIASLGERMSALLVQSVLSYFKIPSRICDLSNILSDSKGLNSDSESFYDDVSVVFRDEILKDTTSVPVVTGFFGPYPGGLLEVVGRGYSDLTAALIARGLGADKVKEMQVWKEVDGVCTADPRKVKGTKVLSEISASEAVELTFFGSEVLHPYTMEQVISAGIPIRVLNSLKPELSGTKILPSGSSSNTSRENFPTAVTAKRGVVMLSISSNRMYDAKGFLARLFSILHKYDLVVDLVSTSEVTVSCTVNNLNKLKLAVPELETLGSVEIEDNRAIIAVVGDGLKNHKTARGDIFSSLGVSGIPVDMVTQAATRTSISCVIHEDQVENALTAVHDTLFKTNT